MAGAGVLPANLKKADCLGHWEAMDYSKQIRHRLSQDRIWKATPGSPEGTLGWPGWAKAGAVLRTASRQGQGTQDPGH